MADIISQFMGALDLFLVWNNILAIIVGMSAGITVGAIPGLGATMTIALLLPFTFSMKPVAAICMLLGIYKGSTYGGSISAILIHSPGTIAAAATAEDGKRLDAFADGFTDFSKENLGSQYYKDVFNRFVDSLDVDDGGE